MRKTRRRRGRRRRKKSYEKDKKKGNKIDHSRPVTSRGKISLEVKDRKKSGKKIKRMC